MNRISSIALAIVVSIGSCRAASALTINFDPQGTPPGDLPTSITAMGNSPGSAVPSSAQLSNQYDADGVLFGSSAPYIAVVDIGSGIASPPNAIGGATSGGLLSYADPVKVTFVVPGTSTPGVTSNVSITADSSGISSQFATLSAFDIDGNKIDTQTLSDVGGETWNLDVTGIHSVQFDFPTTSTGVPTTGSAFGQGTGIALDNLTFGTVTGSTTPPAVPLPPAVWSAVITLGSLVGIGKMRRRLAAQ